MMGPNVVSQPDDVSLMEAVARRDRRAFELLYDRHSGLVFSVCLRVLQQPADAEDALIDTFWEVWQKGHRYDLARGSVTTYLALLARSRAIDVRRSRSTRSAQAGQGSSAGDLLVRNSPSEEDDQPLEAIVSSEDGEQVRRALKKISPAQREAIEMAFYQGLSHREIAEAMRQPLGTIKTRIRQGLIQLRGILRTVREEGQP